MYQQRSLTTKRLTTAYFRAGEGNQRKLLLLHGNLSSSVFFLPLFERLEREYDVVAADMRCYGDSSALPVDATRGYRDWADDIAEFTAALGWDRFVLGGWSLGGCVAMQYTMDRGEQVEALILISPGSPFGFGGTKGVDGQPLDPIGLASGAGIVSAPLVRALMSGNRELIRLGLIGSIYFKPGFRMPFQWERLLTDGIAKTKVGIGMYPGDVRPAYKWPFVAAGDAGVCNAMTPLHGDLSAFADTPVKPPVLWMRGDHDMLISDRSMCDLPVLGRMGLSPGWPGDRVAPPQPMVSQTRYILDKYAANGGSYREIVLPGAHCCYLESPEQFVDSLRVFLS